MEPTSSLARRLWNAIEPVHAVVYFDPGPTDELQAAGLRGGRMCYFAGRFSALGAVGPGPVVAMAYNFSPRMVRRALPDGWRFVPPDRVLDVWSTSAAAALARHLARVDRSVIGDASALVADAAAACRSDGRPLAAGWLDVPVSADPYLKLWLGVTGLREHRGDGHVLASVAAGLRGLEATQMHAATGAVTRDLMQRNRGWTDDEWDESARRLEGRGIIDRDGRLTKSGGSLRRQIEDTTDRLAAGPIERLGQSGVERLIDLVVPLSRHLIDIGVVPIPYGVGVPRP